MNKVHLAIEQKSEEERRQSLVSAARNELQSKYQQAFQQRAVSAASAESHLNKERGDARQDGETSPGHVQKDTALETRQDGCVSNAAQVETMETVSAEAPLNSDETDDGELVKALDRVTLSEPADQIRSKPTVDYFLQKQQPTKPHYVTVLEKTETSTVPRKQNFKPNQ